MRNPHNLSQSTFAHRACIAARLCVYVFGIHLLSGCAAVALSLVGAGAGAGINHQLSGTASHTFSEPLPKVKKATLVALKRMTIRLNTTDQNTDGETLEGVVGDLNIAVDIETLSTTATRVSVVARKNMFQVDAATAQEIIVQTEKALIKS